MTSRRQFIQGGAAIAAAAVTAVSALASAAVAGISAFNAMFLLDMFARDVGMRVIYRGHHAAGANGGVVNELFGPCRQRHWQGELEQSGHGWTSATARMLASWPVALNPTAAPHSNIALASTRGVGPDVLVSWTIATPVAVR